MKQERDTIYLVDGSSYIHRAYHAIGNLANSRGLPTNAVFGFVKMILKLIEDRKPNYMAIAFDAKGPTFRHELYDMYKANRPPMPEDLSAQIPYIHAFVKGLNVTMIEKEGFEADDILGTLARRAERDGWRVVIVTGDKDFRQLLSPRISLWDTMKDRETDMETFKAEFGLDPSQVIDVMGLSGDYSDNIPGVPGVGEKTAVKLIKQFQNLEGVFDHLEEIKGKKLQENLRVSKEQALLSKQLVTIDCDVPLDVNIPDMRVGEPDGEVLAKIFRELEFRSLWDQFATRKDSGRKDYRLCLSENELRRLLLEIERKRILSIDTETTSEDPLKARLVGISFCFEEKKAYYLPLAHKTGEDSEQVDLARALEILKPVLEEEGVRKVGQNIKYDALVFKTHGVELKGIHFDTMIASYVINPGLRQHGLDYLAQHYLDHKMITYKEVVGKKASSFAEVDLEHAKEYSCEDADITFRLMRVLADRLKEDGNQDLFYNLEMRLVPVLIDMEFVGIKIDSDFFKDMSRRIERQLKEMEKKIFKEAGMEFNINSPQQLGYVLFEKLKLPPLKKTAKTKSYSTDVKVLTQLAALPYEIPKLLLRYRLLTKLKSTYLDTLVKLVDPSTGRIHTSFNQTVTATGRLSSSNPNLQNIPIRGEEGREIRKGFVAEQGYVLLSSDYSQVELRVFAHYSEDRAFLEAFRKGEDVHTRTAAEIMGVSPDEVTPDMRRIAKAINFGIIYGMGPRKLGEELGIGQKEAKRYIDTYYKRYPGVVRYREEAIETARKKGYVTTLFNRRRYLPNIEHKNRIIRSESERMAVNTPIQGTAADLIKKAMIRIHERLKKESPETRMLLQVHDELVFEVPEAEIEKVKTLVKEEMEGVYPLKVPLKADIKIGLNWQEAH
ncbi:MAG: DNA polymerase I [Deltaproteobacteria bacterium]|nr:DNA polymerase I [Deltaproteobacteria bacterium]